MTVSLAPITNFTPSAAPAASVQAPQNKSRIQEIDLNSASCLSSTALKVIGIVLIIIGLLALSLGTGLLIGDSTLLYLGIKWNPVLAYVSTAVGTVFTWGGCALREEARCAAIAEEAIKKELLTAPIPLPQAPPAQLQPQPLNANPLPATPVISPQINPTSQAIQTIQQHLQKNSQQRTKNFSALLPPKNNLALTGQASTPVASAAPITTINLVSTPSQSLNKTMHQRATAAVPKLKITMDYTQPLPQAIVTNARAELNLSNQGLKALSSSLSSNDVINASNNKLTSLPNNIGQLSGLLGLYVNKNQLTNLPDSIGDLASLQILQADNNHLKTLPISIGDLWKLEHLSLACNKLTVLPDEITDLRELTFLDVNTNKLTGLPEDIGDLVKLKFLDISANSISELPDSISNLKNLERLRACQNKLKELPAGLNLSSLTVLYLDGNKLTNLSTIAYAVNLSNLTTLSFKDNQVSNLLLDFTSISKLKVLNASNNKITELDDSIDELSELENLDLGKNKLTALPKTIGNLATLTHLDISNNPLKSIPDEIASLPKLQKLIISEDQKKLLPKGINPSIVQVVKNPSFFNNLRQKIGF